MPGLHEHRGPNPGLFRLAARAGPSRVKQMVMFGEFLGAATCKKWGLADEIAPAGEAAEVGWPRQGRIARLKPHSALDYFRPSQFKGSVIFYGWTRS